jgi:2-polyprenyl-6-hydroxyphenyl methylase/3-demethylubiquinone-9 3-methyltransferase
MALTSSPKGEGPARRGGGRRSRDGAVPAAAAAPPPAPGPTVRPEQAALFGALASDWWDPRGRSRLLHRINPARLGWVRAQCDARFGWDPRAVRPAAGMAALDVGCGGGLLSEPLARLGFAVTGLDAAAESIAVARDHAAAQGLAIDYRVGDVTALAAERPGGFDLVTCMEVVEHVADLPAFLGALRALLRPEGLLVFSTPNRTALSWAVLIVGAERITRDIPVGAHDWRAFLKPEELRAALEAAGFSGVETTGLGWRPGRGFVAGASDAINYLGRAVPA